MQPHPPKDFEILSTLPGFLLNVNSTYWERTLFLEVKGQTDSNLDRGVLLSSDNGLAEQDTCKIGTRVPSLFSWRYCFHSRKGIGSECHPRENFYL